MKREISEDAITIRLCEKISETNSKQVSTEISVYLTDVGDRDIVFDCVDLKYISSAGLRTMLKLQKEHTKHSQKIKLINVRDTVKSVLDITGFTEIFDVHMLPKTCSVVGLPKIGESINGSLYELSKGIMIKAYKKYVTLDEVETEREMARKSLVLGIPTAISFSEVMCDDGYGIMFEEIHGDSLAHLLAKSPEMCRKYAEVFANLVKELHRTPIEEHELPSIKSRYHEWLDQARDRLTEQDWNRMSALVDATDDCNTYVHGNLNLTNVFLVDGELMLMDMASCGYGHPIFDLQAIYATLVAIEKVRPGYCRGKLGLDPELCREFWKYFMKAYTEDSTLGVSDDMIVETGSSATVISLTKLNTLLNEYYVLKERLLYAL